MSEVSRSGRRRWSVNLAGAKALALALALIGSPGSGAGAEPDAAVAPTVEAAPGLPARDAPGTPAPRDWIGVPVLLKDAETALRVGKKVIIRNDLQRRFVVEKVSGDWLWVVSGNVKGWVKQDEVIALDQAVRYFTGVIRSDPAAAWAYVRRALVWYEKREFDIALGDYTEALQLEPKNVLALVNRGIARLAKHDFDGAIADFDAALRIEPRDAAAYADRGLARLAKSDDDGAIADFDASLRFDPNDSAVHNYRGNARSRKGEYENAIAQSQGRLGVQQPRLAAGHLPRGGASQRQGRGGAGDPGQRADRLARPLSTRDDGRRVRRGGRFRRRRQVADPGPGTLPDPGEAGKPRLVNRDARPEGPPDRGSHHPDP